MVELCPAAHGNPDLVVDPVWIIVGANLGLSSHHFLSGYLTPAPLLGHCDTEHNCVLNFHPKNLGHPDTADWFNRLTKAVWAEDTTGVELKEENPLLELSAGSRNSVTPRGPIPTHMTPHQPNIVT